MANDWLKRYVAGEHETVWAEMQKVGAGQAYSEEVGDVIRETMLRVRRNVEMIINRLHDAGYEFVDPSSNGYLRRIPHVPPADTSPAFADWLDELAGPLPASIVGWITLVGDVNLVGNHPEWPEHDMMTDALVVEFEFRGYADRGPGWSAKEFYENELNDWKEAVAEDGADNVGPFLLPFAPDSYHKINVSGGSPYGIYLPDGSVDALCQIDGRDIRFIEYLRECFQWGGFPGARSLPQIPSLCHDLLPI